MTNDDEFSLPDYVVPGATIRWFWGEGNPNNKLVHIRAIVDDEWVVYRWWSRRKGWRYKIEWAYWFWLLDREGRATVVKRGGKTG
jgi:hypothetical protein